MSAPPRVATWLRAAGDASAEVLHRGPDAVYVAVSGRCVGVVGTRASAIPCAVRSMLPTLPRVGSASVRAGVLHLDDEPLVVGRLVDVQVPRLAGPPVAEVRGALAPSLGAPQVRQLLGRGDGLTPYGDDVLCGWLAVHRAAGVATPEVDSQVRALSHRTTLLSATLLDCAMAGEVVPEFAAWLAGTGGAEAVERIGHSSGRGLLEGGRLALAALGLERMAG